MVLFLLLFLPTFFQILMGGKSKRKAIVLSFDHVCLISYLLQVLVCAGIFFYMTTSNLYCGLPFAGLIMLNILFMIVITIVIVMQYFRYRY